MTFARWLFRLAGICGLLVLLRQYFMEEQLGRDYPPPVTHPEHFYGFLGVAVAWQVAFLVIAQDPARYRPFMLPAVLEKVSFGVAALDQRRPRRVDRHRFRRDPEGFRRDLEAHLKPMPGRSSATSTHNLRLDALLLPHRIASLYTDGSRPPFTNGSTPCPDAGCGASHSV